MGVILTEDIIREAARGRAYLLSVRRRLNIPLDEIEQAVIAKRKSDIARRKRDKEWSDFPGI